MNCRIEKKIFKRWKGKVKEQWSQEEFKKTILKILNGAGSKPKANIIQQARGWGMSRTSCILEHRQQSLGSQGPVDGMWQARSILEHSSVKVMRTMEKIWVTEDLMEEQSYNKTYSPTAHSWASICEAMFIVMSSPNNTMGLIMIQSSLLEGQKMAGTLCRSSNIVRWETEWTVQDFLIRTGKIRKQAHYKLQREGGEEWWQLRECQVSNYFSKPLVGDCPLQNKSQRLQYALMEDAALFLELSLSYTGAISEVKVGEVKVEREWRIKSDRQLEAWGHLSGQALYKAVTQSASSFSKGEHHFICSECSTLDKTNCCFI